VADSRITVRDRFAKAGIDPAQCLRESLAWLWQPRMEAEGTAPIGASPPERAPGHLRSEVPGPPSAQGPRAERRHPGSGCVGGPPAAGG